MERDIVRQVLLASEEIAAAKAVSGVNARHTRERDELATRPLRDVRHHIGPGSLEARWHNEDLEALTNKRGKAVNGNRHDLPRSSV